MQATLFFISLHSLQCSCYRGALYVVRGYQCTHTLMDWLVMPKISSMLISSQCPKWGEHTGSCLHKHSCYVLSEALPTPWLLRPHLCYANASMQITNQMCQAVSEAGGSLVSRSYLLQDHHCSHQPEARGDCRSCWGYETLNPSAGFKISPFVYFTTITPLLGVAEHAT